MQFFQLQMNYIFFLLMRSCYLRIGHHNINRQMYDE